LRQTKGSRFTGLAVIGAIGVLLSFPANGTSFEELAGYSIEAHFTLTVVWRELNPRSTETLIAQKTYFSTSGRIFDYSNYAAGGFADKRPTIMALDKPQSVGRGNMQLWAMQGGNLTLVVRLVEGLVVRTIAVDPARSTCTITVTTQPDPTTGRLVQQRLDGLTGEMVSVTPHSLSCAIKRGNVFASDQ
jgi:hypothetical protein